MNGLNELRSQLTRRQREVLSTIWRLFLKENRWAPARYIHEAEGGKKIVRPILEELGGAILYEFDENGTIKYQLTLLGVLLSTQGEVFEAQLVDYIKLAKSLALRDIHRTHVSSQEVRTKLNLDAEEGYELGCILSLSPFVSSGSFGLIEWNAGLPRNIEDIPDDPLPYTHNVALAGYDPKIPLPLEERRAYISSSGTQSRVDIFSFIGHEHLRVIIARDWIEAQLCFGAKAWKACIIACGSVLEAILLDGLLPHPDKARAALKERQPDRKVSKEIRRWDLVDLVNAAAEMGIIGEASSHLGHALRLHRDLVHPGRQLKELVEVTEGEAQIGLNTVEKCIRDLSANTLSKEN